MADPYDCYMYDHSLKLELSGQFFGIMMDIEKKSGRNDFELMETLVKDAFKNIEPLEKSGNLFDVFRIDELFKK